MATNSARNLSYEQTMTMAGMWPESLDSIALGTKYGNPPAYVQTPPGASMTYKENYDPKQELLDKMGSEAVKADSGKPDWSLVPFEALEGMVRVLEFGANKYQAYNFASGKGLEYTRLISAALRHLMAFSRGEDLDPESGLPYIYHCQCNLLFLAYFTAHKDKFTENDNRHKN